MTDQAPAIFVALEASSFAAAIRQSLWLYPAANVGHIIALVFFAGSVAVMDVRQHSGRVPYRSGGGATAWASAGTGQASTRHRA